MFQIITVFTFPLLRKNSLLVGFLRFNNQKIFLISQTENKNIKNGKSNKKYFGFGYPIGIKKIGQKIKLNFIQITNSFWRKEDREVVDKH